MRVRSDVPQGTVMGPLLFLIYIISISVQGETTKIQIFADDALLYCRVDDEFR